MHYRVPVYNYFNKAISRIRFRILRDHQLSTEAESETTRVSSSARCRSISSRTSGPLALSSGGGYPVPHLKDWIVWPLIHWMKLCRIPFAFWTKGGNWDAKSSKLRYQMFNYVHGMSDALILYADACRNFIKPRFHGKTFVANNTINFNDFPAVHESEAEIKREFGIRSRNCHLHGTDGAGNGRKRVDHLIEMFRILDRQDIGLVLVGSGLSEELKARMNPRNTVYLGKSTTRKIGKSASCARWPTSVLFLVMSVWD